MGKIVRLLISLGIIVAAVLITEPLGDLMTPLAGWIIVGLINTICWDFLDVGILDNGFGIFIKRVLFYGCAIFALFASVAVAYQDLINGQIYSYNQFEQIAICGSLPATVVTLLICYYLDLQDYDRAFSPLPMLGGIIAGAVIGFVLSMFAAAGPMIALIAIFAVSGFGLFLWVKYSFKTGLMFDSVGTGSLGGDDYSSSSYSSSSYSGSSRGSSSSSSNYYNTSSSSSTYSQGYSDLEYYMSDIAYRNSRSRNCSYGISVRSQVSKSLYGDTASFTVDFEIDTTGCCAQTQSEINVALRDVENFQREIMQDVYRDAQKLIKRLMDKYPDFEGVNLEVNPGNVSQY